MPRPLVDLPRDPDLDFEQQAWGGGLRRVAGLDEAGRGALAGPVSAAAVILPADAGVLERLRGVRDSKQMTARQRAAWAGRIQAEAVGWAVGWASVEEIDAVNILNATRLAMERALAGMGIPPERLLLDALRLPRVACEQVAIIHGDARCLSIAAASVLAKTARDTLLGELDRQYPGYGFAEHKGYGTLRHRQALEQLGPCPAHRLSFAPLRERLAEQSG